MFRTVLVMVLILDQIVSTKSKNRTKDLTDLFIFIRADTKEINPVQRVVNGRPANLGEVPYQVAVKYQIDSNSFITICGGAIVRPSTVISAAHCFLEDTTFFMRRMTCTSRKLRDLNNLMIVAANMNNIGTFRGANVDGQWRKLKSVSYPIEYEFPEYDIAVLSLKTPFNYDNNVQQIPYASTGFRDYHGDCVASGYGRKNREEQSKVLRVASLAVLSNDVCRRTHRRRMTRFVCSSDLVSDVERGDSGGPLVCFQTRDPRESKRGLLVGVVSGHRVGAGSFFTRVSYFSQYIDKGISHSTKPFLNLIRVFTVLLYLNANC